MIKKSHSVGIDTQPGCSEGKYLKLRKSKKQAFFDKTLALFAF